MVKEIQDGGFFSCEKNIRPTILSQIWISRDPSDSIRVFGYLR
jgi:hypothetical protein